jgi:hypothetical protein
MSLPSFPPKDSLLTRDEAIDAILTSIAMEETALSHVLNAEGEKIQAAVEHATRNIDCCDTIHDLLELNNSVSRLVEQITDLQFILKSKLKIVSSLIPLPYPAPCPSRPTKPTKPTEPTNPCQPQPPKPCPPHPSKPRHPPSEHCKAVFAAKNRHCWKNGTILPLYDESDCKSPVKLLQSHAGNQIYLPCGRKYRIEISLNMHKTLCDNKVSVEVSLLNGCETVRRKKITPYKEEPDIIISETLEWELPISPEEYKLIIRLDSGEPVRVEHGKISIEEIY